MTDSELDQLLKVSASSAPPHTGFQRDVWLRIETAESAGSKPAMERILQCILGCLALPPVAVATCTAMIAVGAWLGLKTETPNAGREMSYVQAISPFAQIHR